MPRKLSSAEPWPPSRCLGVSSGSEVVWCCSAGPLGVGTLVVADAGLYHHDREVEQAARGAAKGHGDSAGAVGGTATAVRAQAAVRQPECPNAVAALLLQASWLRSHIAGLAPPCPLKTKASFIL